jgi:hypothetical protein
MSMTSVKLELFEKELERLIEQAAEAGIDGRSVADILRRAAATLDPPGLLNRAEMGNAIEAAKAEAESEARESIDEADDDYFGSCPICHKTDGYANAGRSHRFFCKEHKTSWCVGSNLFSDWHHQTEEEQRRIWNEIGLADFQNVKPYHHPRQYQDDIFPL